MMMKSFSDLLPETILDTVTKQGYHPYYEERRYWEEFSLHIKEQISILQEL